MVVYDSAVGTSDNWQFQNEIFLAWLDVQEFTVPFYQMANPSTTDYIFLPAVNGAPPTAAGFAVQGIVGYAYSTQVCGSVPLLSAVSSATSDHWWTTNQVEHDQLIAQKSGWVDGGVPFFVLPLGMSICF